MTSETTHTEKFILDATAGNRQMWFNKNHPNCLYIDQRPECEPDLIADFTALKEVPDNSKKLVIFDPPHIVQKNPYGGSQILKEYGYLKPETWQTNIKQAFSELWRVLEPYGVLLFKWTNTHISSNELIALAPCKPLIYQKTRTSKTKYKKAHPSNSIKTLWFTFMKIPEGEI